MNKLIKRNSGITIIALVLTIIIMMIIMSIAVYQGKDIIRKAKLQTLETNMLTIQAKAKTYAEEIDAKVWALESNKESKRDELFSEKGLEKTATNEYKVTDEGLEIMGLEELKGEEYTVVYSNDFNSIDIKYGSMVTYNNKSMNKLSELQKELGE